LSSKKKKVGTPEKQQETRKASKGMLMRFDMPSCGGCRTCEMACSFHHRGEFVPTVSSLLIVDKENVTGCDVVIVDRPDDQRAACDGCENLEIPLCVEHCRESDDLWKILQAFLEKRSKPENEKRR
jgi:Fe-S-cluster-containing dehydrogenase component